MIVKSSPGFLSKLPTLILKSLKFCVDIGKYLGFGLWGLGGLIVGITFATHIWGNEGLIEYTKLYGEGLIYLGFAIVLTGFAVIWIIDRPHSALEFALFDRSRLPAASAQIIFHGKDDSKWQEVRLIETREKYSRSERSPHKNLTNYTKSSFSISLRVCLGTFSYSAASTNYGTLGKYTISGFGNLSLLDVGSRRYKKFLGTDLVPTLSVFGQPKTSLIRYQIVSSEAYGEEPNTYRYIPYKRTTVDHVDQKSKLVSVCLQIALPNKIIEELCEINSANEVGAITLNVGTQKSDGLYQAGFPSNHYKVLFDTATVEVEKVAGESMPPEHDDLEDNELKKTPNDRFEQVYPDKQRSF